MFDVAGVSSRTLSFEVLETYFELLALLEIYLWFVILLREFVSRLLHFDLCHGDGLPGFGFNLGLGGSLGSCRNFSGLWFLLLDPGIFWLFMRTS